MSTSAEQNAPTAVSSLQLTSGTSVCKLWACHRASELSTLLHTERSQRPRLLSLSLTSEQPDFIAKLWFCVFASLLSVQYTNFCKGSLGSSSNPHSMNSDYSSLSTDADWQSSLLPSWCLKLVLAGVFLSS